MEYQKVKSVSKKIQAKGASLEKTILSTMKTISSIVGATLGPGGRAILIERQEYNLGPMVTKDGVTVFRSLGFDDAAQQCIMEAARDASVRTASEAGDGTTTATILSEAIVRLTKEFCQKNPRVSPQRVVRRLEKAFKDTIEPTIKALSVQADLSTPEGRKMLKAVASVSANGDSDLADAVMECFDLVGDEGNVTISELSGSSRYEVERIEGFPVLAGYEDSCSKFYPKFINDPGNQRVVMDKPTFLVYNGRIDEVQTIAVLLNRVGYAWQGEGFSHNLVLVAQGFSGSVLGYLATMFAEAQALNVYPLLAPQSPFPNGQLHFLEDLAAITGATLADPLNLPIDQVQLEHLGPGVKVFEASRFRSNIVGRANEDLLLLRVDELQTQLSRAESQLDSIYLQERIGKLTGGIARLKVIGASNGELKEKRDRAEDAVCAVRGAIKFGCLPGGGWTLMRLMKELKDQCADDIVSGVLIPALFEPVKVLLENVGINELNDDEFRAIIEPILKPISCELSEEKLGWVKKARTEEEFLAFMVRYRAETKPVVYDALESKHVDPFVGGILDSTPAVLEAIRNSISIASLLGTLGGTVVFARDLDTERTEARDMANWVRDANQNPADERP